MRNQKARGYNEKNCIVHNEKSQKDGYCLFGPHVGLYTRVSGPCGISVICLLCRSKEKNKRSNESRQRIKRTIVPKFSFLFENSWNFTYFEFPSNVFFIIDSEVIKWLIIQWNSNNWGDEKGHQKNPKETLFILSFNQRKTGWDILAILSK